MPPPIHYHQTVKHGHQAHKSQFHHSPAHPKQSASQHKTILRRLIQLDFDHLKRGASIRRDSSNIRPRPIISLVTNRSPMMILLRRKRSIMLPRPCRPFLNHNFVTRRMQQPGPRIAILILSNYIRHLRRVNPLNESLIIYRPGHRRALS